MKKEFEAFRSIEEVQPPIGITEKILSQIKRDLNPSSLFVFRKLALIQFVTGIITLLFCPQFGIGLTGSMGLMGLLMRFGDHICMAGCGAVFLGISAFSAVMILKPEELRVLHKNQIVQFSVLSLSVAGVFICLGAPILTTIGMAWFAGAVLGGLLTFKVGEKIRFQYI